MGGLIWKRRIEPRVGLRIVEPVLYTTPMTGEKSALSQYACPTFKSLTSYSSPDNLQEVK
jgi:hypothetical protein